MSRRRSKQKRDQQPADGPSPVPSSSGWSGVVAVLFLVRDFVPAEATDLGATLWIAQLWFGIAALIVWQRQRRGQRSLPLDIRGCAVLGLIGAHVFASLLVMDGSGDRRAAINMLWEWSALGVSYFLMSGLIRDQALRSKLLQAVVIVCVLLSGLGLWQHFVWYPQTAKTFDTYLHMQTQVAEDHDLSRSERRKIERRVETLRRSFGADVAGLDEASLALLRSRLTDSTEPLGRFALANTFAGMLLVGVILAVGMLLRSSAEARARWIVAALCCLLVLCCLLLTKSRTAYAGGIVATLIAGVALMTGKVARRRLWLQLSAVGLVMVLLVGGLVASGSIDREVLSETPKSLEYRLEYWRATWQVIGDAPIFGVGPGNFRQHYLHHKLPGSSEEITDPHNLFLDVWANGGLLALGGLIAVLVTHLLPALTAGRRSADEATTLGDSRSNDGRWLAGVIGSAIGIVWLGQGVFQGLWELQLLLLAIAGVLLSLASSRLNRVPVATSGLCVLAVVALVIHLLGAGGIAMPVILQTLLLLLLCASMTNTGTDRWQIRVPTVLVMVSLSVMFIACAFTATRPVLVGGSYLEAGRYSLTIDRDLDRAERELRQATLADPLLADAWQERSAVRFTQWRQAFSRQSVGAQATDVEPLLQEAIDFQQIAINADPASALRYRRMAELHRQSYEQTGDERAIARAVESYSQAVSRYPHHAQLRAEYATTLNESGSPRAAAEQATRALSLDDLNAANRHLDKLIGDDVRQEMERIRDAT